jgi:hypothetical protein
VQLTPLVRRAALDRFLGFSSCALQPARHRLGLFFSATVVNTVNNGTITKLDSTLFSFAPTVRRDLAYSLTLLVFPASRVRHLGLFFSVAVVNTINGTCIKLNSTLFSFVFFPRISSKRKTANSVSFSLVSHRRKN